VLRYSQMESMYTLSQEKVFTNGKYVHIEPGEQKSKAGDALGSMINKIGIPNKIFFWSQRATAARSQNS
jgi:hypothetical protein